MDMDSGNKETIEMTPKSERESDHRKVRVLWAVLIMYFLIMVNAFRYAYKVPYQILILASLVNAAIILSIIVTMRRIYKRIRS
jgi:hypothetical protein